MSIIKKEKRGKKGGGGIERNAKKNDNAEAGIFSPRVTAMAFVRKTFSVRRWFALEMNRVCACIGNE